MSTGFFPKNKEKFQKKSCKRYQDLSEEDKNE